ncbi:MAG: amidohydrolase family protein [Bryobacteraceae bacterium]
MRIDCATQLVDRARFHYPFLEGAPQQMQRDFTIHALGAILSRNRYEGGVVLALLDDPAETDWLLALSLEHSAILAVMGHTTDARDLDRWQRHPRFRGVRHRYGPGSAAWISELGARGLRCDLEIDPAQLPLLSPASHVALAHTAGACYRQPQLDAWAAAVESWPGMIKIDGLINGAGEGKWSGAAYRPWIDHLMQCAGPARLMYGSDWPRCMHSGIWKESLAAFTQALGPRTMDVRSWMLGENAARHYGIGSAAVEG